jgi:hypothetical protein
MSSLGKFGCPFNFTFDVVLATSLWLALYFFEEAIFDFESVFGPVSLGIVLYLLYVADDCPTLVFALADGAAAWSALGKLDVALEAFFLVVDEEAFMHRETIVGDVDSIALKPFVIFDAQSMHRLALESAGFSSCNH